MVITRLIGGLGNQMFQYAAGRTLSLRHNTDLKVDLSFLEQDPAGAYTQRKFELDVFSAPVNVIRRQDVSGFLHQYNSGINGLINKVFPSRLAKHYFIEKGPYYHADIFKTSADVFISGFWQNENYFSRFADVIRKDLAIKKEFLGGTDEHFKKITSVNSVFLHVRRGDYITNSSANAFHGVCSPAYYQQAVKKIAETQQGVELFIFSDDVDWCRSNLSFGHPYHFIETGSAVKDLYLMQNCRHAVIANSSFSWWAAWLIANPEKKIIAPAKWFNDPGVQNNEIVPVNWIKL